MTGWRWENPEAPPLLFLHATGFCASAYRQILSHVSCKYDIYALDLRGHGLNTTPADPARLHSWGVFRDDIRAFLDSNGRSAWTLAGHSLGGAVSLLAAQDRTDVAELRLVEPVAVPLWLSALAKTPIWPMLSPRMPLVKMAARRRSEWDDRESVVASYARKSLFSAWAPGVLEDYLADGLIAEGGKVRLSCSPAWEAATFAAQANDFWEAAAAAPAPVRVFVARNAASTAPAFARRRLVKMGANIVTDESAGHLAPMQKPRELADFLTS